MSPQLSIFCSGSRPFLWPYLFHTLDKNEVDYELIIVSDQEPEKPFPDHGTFIYSTVKPSQCYHIASLHCKGSHLLNIGDDCYYRPNAIDRMMDTFNYVYDPHRNIVSALFGPKANMYLSRKPYNPIMAVGSLMTRELWDELGGIDRNFVGMWWDLDLSMRLYQLGGRVTVCRKAVMQETLKIRYCNTHEHSMSKIHRNYQDRDLFDSLWRKDGKVLSKRIKKVEPFEERGDLLTVSQGRTGPWQ